MPWYACYTCYIFLQRMYITVFLAIVTEIGLEKLNFMDLKTSPQNVTTQVKIKELCLLDLAKIMLYSAILQGYRSAKSAS